MAAASAPATPYPSVDPALGVLHLETEPVALPEPLAIRYVGTAPQLSGPPDLVPAGKPVFLDRAVAPGSVRVEANGHMCVGSAQILAGVEADMIVDPGQLGCTLTVRYDHPVGSIHHPITGAIFGAVVFQGSTVVLQHLDPGSTQPPIEVVAGPTGIEPMEIPLGRYKVTATLRGELLKSVEYDYGPGSDAVLDLMALPPSTPRTCGTYDAATCEAFINAALAYAQWVSPDDVVKAAAIVPTDVEDCGNGIQAPLIDVHFDLAPDGGLVVTVGHLGSGRLVACTY
jgi:hypothetical protein